MAYDNILSQLQSQKAFFKYDYGNSSLDPWLTSELARLIASTGVTDIRNIAQYKSTLPFTDWYGNTSYMPVSYFYDALTGKKIDKIGGGDFDPRIADDVFATTNNADFDFTFLIRFPGPYFVVGVKPREKVGTWFSMAAPLIPVAMIALNIFAPGFATVIGNSILGPLGVASTTLATTLGNVIVGTVASGGDVEGAVKGAMLGNLGAGVGAAVGGSIGAVLNSDLIAKAASAATSAAITGGDMKLAVAGTFLPAGIQLVQDTFTDLTTASPAAQSSPAVMETNAMDETIDYSVDYPWMADTGTLDSPVTGTYDFTTATSMDPTFDWGVPVTVEGTDYGSGTIADTVFDYPFETGNYEFTPPIFDVEFSTPDIPVYTDTPDIKISGPTADQSGTTWAQAASQVALAALKLYTVYNSAGQPPVQTSGQTARGVVVAQPNGTVLVNGQVKLPPKGVPYLTPDGQLIMNNGDGTYSSVSSTGLKTTTPYPSGMSSGSLFGGMDQKTMLMIGGGLIAVLLLAKR